MLLKAMGFWIWGLIAISLSVSFVTLSYRLGAGYRPSAGGKTITREEKRTP
jgi:hypothetical protein